MLSQREKDQLARKHLALARWCARKHRYGEEEFEELLADALLGMARALNTWDPDCGSSFTSWAVLKMHGAVVDGKRRRDYLTRGQRHSGVTIRPPISLDVRVVTERGNLTPGPLDYLADPDSDMTAAVELRAQIDELPARQRFAVLASVDGMTNRKIADLLGVTESRVCQILKAARATL